MASCMAAGSACWLSSAWVLRPASVFTAIAMGIVLKVIDSTVGLRVSQDTELRGLDIEEHGMESYSGFQIFTTE